MKKLSLKRETLRELTVKEMNQAAGGMVSIIPTQCYCTGYYPSLNAPCGPAASRPCVPTTRCTPPN